jgi:predicted nucleic acid-binding protein
MLVVDASAIVELLLGRPAAVRVERHFHSHDFDLHAPHLLDVEVLSALRAVAARGIATAARCAAAVDDLLDLPVTRHPHDILTPRMWSLRDSLSAYDATYLALAEVLTHDGAALLTADARFARGAKARSDVDLLVV